MYLTGAPSILERVKSTSEIPNLNGIIPAATDENIIIILVKLNAEDAVGVARLA